MDKEKTLIVGGGEIGKSLAKVFADAYDVIVIDKDNPLMGTFKTMHVAIPFSDKFVEIVNEYRARFKPELTIIHGTVKPGTTAKFGKGVVYSPVNGKHPNLEESIRKFVKVIGGDNVYDVFKAVAFLRNAGVDTQVFSSSKTAELAKVLCTTRYGWVVMEMKETARICNEMGVPFHEVYTEWNSIYNNGYDNMNCNLYHRPVLTPQEGEIGGHCVINNTKLLDDFLTRTLSERNEIYKKGEIYDSPRSKNRKHN